VSVESLRLGRQDATAHNSATGPPGPWPLPAARNVVGTALLSTGEQPFSYDLQTDTFHRGFDRPDRTPSHPFPAQLARVEPHLRAELGVGLDQIRIGELHCGRCDAWFDVMREPSAWSLAMCIYCSMDEPSEMADAD
jgi:hypothetical protein